MHERSLQLMLSAFIFAAAMTTASNAVLAGNAPGELAADGQDTNKTNSSDFIDKIEEGIHTAKQAIVVLLPVNLYFSITLTEEGFKGSGCTFVTTDPSRIASLVDILKRANVRVPLREPPFWSVHEGIYLTLANEEKVSFLFGLSDQGNPIGGEFRSPRSRLPVVADAALFKELYLWAQKTGGLVPNIRCGDLF